MGAVAASVRRQAWGLLVLLVAGCHGAGAAPTVVEFWAMGREGELVQQLVPAFEAQHPGWHVRVQQVPWSAAHEKLLTAFVGGSMPDVFQLGNTWIPEFVALQAIEPLDAWIAARDEVPTADFFPGVWDTNVVGGTAYGVPWYVDTRLLFYRADLFAAAGIREVPATWAQWLEAMTRLQQAIGPDRRAVLLPLTEWEPPVIFALQRGAPLLRDGDRYGHFRDPAFRRALDFYLEFFRRGLALRSAGSQVANLYLDFGAGYFASFLSGPWSIGELRERLPRDLAGAWATAPLPAPDGPAPGVSLAGGASLALFRGARHKPAAWAWMTYLLEPARQVEFHRLTGDLPSRRTAWTEAGLMQEPHAAAFWRQLPHVRSTPKIPEWERIAQKVSQYVEAAVREDLTADAAVAALDHDVDAILEKRRWLLDRGQGAAAPGR